MDDETVEFYSQQRWDNWLDRLSEADLDDEEEATRLFLNLQSDTAIAVAKVLDALDDDAIDADRAGDELARIQSIVYDEVDTVDEASLELIDAVQTSLVAVFGAADRYVAGEDPPATPPGELIDRAAAAEAEEDFERALERVTDVGVQVIDGSELDIGVTEDIEFGLVTEWLGGIDSLQAALAGPKVVED